MCVDIDIVQICLYAYMPIYIYIYVCVCVCVDIDIVQMMFPYFSPGCHNQNSDFCLDRCLLDNSKG